MNKAVFLDRDGTINEEKYYLHEINDFQYKKGVIEGLKSLVDAGFKLIIITNQSGIARGFYPESDYQKLTEWMLNDLSQKEIDITAVYYCPHHPEGKVKKYAVDCDCRKPKTELFWRAARENDIDMDSSFAIGDKLRDLAIIGESGVRGILIGDNAEIPEYYDGIRICATFSDAVDIVMNWEKQNETGNNIGRGQN